MSESDNIPKAAPAPKQNPVNKLLVLMCILLFITCALLGWQLMEKNSQIEYVIAEKVTLEEEKSNLEMDLEQMLSQYNEMETDNADMQEKIAAQKEEIEKLLVQVKENKGLKWQIYKLKKEAASLRRMMQGFVKDIDSLNTLNKGLRKENQTVKQALKDEQSKSSNLTEENKQLTDKVNTASRFVITGLNTTGIRVKGDNTGKNTDRAKKTDKIRTCFTIMKNSVTPSGTQTLFVRILSPDGKVLSMGSGDANKFDFNGVKGLYSVKKVIAYDNDQMNLCLDWKKNADFVPGEYNITVFHQGGDIGRTKIRLK